MARRWFWVVLAALAFGAVMSVLKGNAVGLRDDAGNLSAPWLLLPFFAGAAIRGRTARGAVAGLFATFAGLTAFCVANAFVLDLGPHSTLTDLRLAFTPYWFFPGAVSGPVFGALGSVWRRHGSPVIAVLVVLLLDAEALFWPLAQRMGGVAGFAFEPSAVVLAGEALVGIAACAWLLWAAPRRSAA